jgi:hypothetical protein
MGRAQIHVQRAVQPIKFLLIVNLRAVKALDVEIAPTLIARVDEAIEQDGASAGCEIARVCLTSFPLVREINGR